MALKKPSSRIDLAFGGVITTYFIKVEINTRIQITSTGNTPIRGQETRLTVSVMSPTA